MMPSSESIPCSSCSLKSSQKTKQKITKKLAKKEKKRVRKEWRPKHARHMQTKEAAKSAERREEFDMEEQSSSENTDEPGLPSPWTYNQELRSLAELKRFLGHVSYLRKYIPDFHVLIAPLLSLVSSSRPTELPMLDGMPRFTTSQLHSIQLFKTILEGLFFARARNDPPSPSEISEVKCETKEPTVNNLPAVIVESTFNNPPAAVGELTLDNLPVIPPRSDFAKDFYKVTSAYCVTAAAQLLQVPESVVRENLRGGDLAAAQLLQVSESVIRENVRRGDFDKPPTSPSLRSPAQYRAWGPYASPSAHKEHLPPAYENEHDNTHSE
jgi:hypothetical protein